MRIDPISNRLRIVLFAAVLICGTVGGRGVLLAKPAGKSVHAVARQEIREPLSYEVRNGEARLAEREFDKALFHFKRALKENPKSALGLLGRGDVYRMSHDFPRAVTYYRELIGLKPGLAVGYAYTAMTLVAQGRLDQAEAEISLYEKRLQPNALSHYLRGVIAQRRGVADSAAEHYQAALEREPDFVDVYSDYGLLRAEQGKHDEALRLYRKAQSLAPDSSEVVRRIGDLLHAQGKVKASIAAYEKAVALGPSNAGAHANLAGNYLIEKRYADASQAAERAIELNASLVEPHYTLGMSYAELDMRPDAITALKRFLDLAGDADIYRELKARASERIASLESESARFRARADDEEASERLYRAILAAAERRGMPAGELERVLSSVRDNLKDLPREEREKALLNLLEALSR